MSLCWFPSLLGLVCPSCLLWCHVLVTSKKSYFHGVILGFGLGPGFDLVDLRADTIPVASPPPPPVGLKVRPVLCCPAKNTKYSSKWKPRESQIASCSSSLLSASIHTFFSLCYCSLTSDMFSFPKLPAPLLLMIVVHMLVFTVHFHFALYFGFPLHPLGMLGPAVHTVHCDGPCLTSAAISVIPLPLLPLWSSPNNWRRYLVSAGLMQIILWLLMWGRQIALSRNR